jgi:nondiscriminating glutamyl-tRNA synthetase
MTVRTRFAPSPTGRLHLGNVRTAVFNWLFARHHDGAFVLRIEDTDVERNVPGSEAGLMEDLRWLGLDWDEGPDVGGGFGPYRQSERSGIYESFVERLLDDGHAYPCFCSEEEARGTDRRYPGTCRGLPLREARGRVAGGEYHVVRMALPRSGAVTIQDRVRGEIEFPAEDLDDFILRRRDGRVTYNFAVVVDDVTMEISHVIRGAGHLSNTPKQAVIFDALGVPRPVFVHLPNVLAPEGGKLSKRLGAACVAELRGRGVLPEAVVNYLSLLGWSHPKELEILAVPELVADVDLDRIRAAEMAYDPDKLEWVAGQHFARLPASEVLEGVRSRLDRERFPLPEEGLEAAVDALRSRMVAFGDMETHLGILYPEDGEDWSKVRASVREDPEGSSVVEAARREMEELPEWSRDDIKAAFKRAGAACGARGKGLYHPLRKALFAAENGPDMGILLEAIGRDEALRRLGKVAEG